MDSISVDTDSGVSRINRAPSPLAQKPEAKSTSNMEDASNLTDVPALAAKVKSAGPYIRPEAIERGKALVADPNWPGDAALDKLAETLLEHEDFDS